MISVRARLSVALLLVVTVVGVLSVSDSFAQAVPTDAYFAKEIWTGDGEPIVDGAMVVVDGRIEAVGPRSEVLVPSDAVLHELGSRVIIPGLVISQTNLSGAVSEDRTLTPEIQALDGFDFFADREALLKSGITTIQVSPGNTRLMPGVSGVVQLAGDKIQDRVLAAQESLRIVLSSSARNPPRIYEPAVGPVSEDRPLTATRPQLATLPASLAGLRQIFKQAKPGATFVSDAGPDELAAVVSELIESKIPIRMTAMTAPEIRGAIGLAKEFDLRIVLVDCVGLEPFKSSFESWRPHVRGVVLSGVSPGEITNPTADQIENLTEPWEYARELTDAGIPVTIRPAKDSDLEQIMFVAGQFMHDGLTPVETLASLTSQSAKLMGVDEQVGSLAKGKRADFVVLNNQPFQLHTRVTATYASGEAEFQKQPDAHTTVVNAGRVYVGEGKYLDDASVVVKGKTIRGVGSHVSAPVEAEIRTFDNAVIVPGFVDMGAGLGIGGPLQGTVTLQTKLGSQLYDDDPAIAYARKHGITTALLSGTVSSSPSPVVAFKLGREARVIADPVAIRFKLTGNTASGITTNEKLLKSGKAYADSWTKYEKELVEYQAKLKQQTAAKTEPKKVADSKTDSKAEEKKKREAPGESESDKQKTESKEPDKKDKAEKKPKPLPDPITGTWEGELESERIPPEARVVKFELELNGTEVTGTIDMMRMSVEVDHGSYDRESRELAMTIVRRGNEVEITGSLDEAGKYSGSIESGRGAMKLIATRTEDKSKKPVTEKDVPEKKDKPEEKKDKPEEKKDKPNGEQPPKKDVKGKQETKDSQQSKSKVKDDTAGKKPADAKADEGKPPALKPPKKPKKSDALEPYRALFAGEIPALVESRDLNSIKAAAELFSKQYKLRTVIVGADDLARQPDLLSDYDVSICAGPKFSVTIDKRPPTNLPQLLANERLDFGFQSSGTTGSGKLPSALQYAVSQGLSATDAVEALTAAPARILSSEMSFGTLASGKDADLVVLSGPPFEYSTKVLAVMIDGVWVYERKEQK